MKRLRKSITGLLTSLLFGALLGIISKYLDTVPMIDGSAWHMTLNYLGDLFTRLGIWVLLATFIAIRSKTIIRAALHTLLFFTGMLITYYLYSAYLFGFFPTYYFTSWGMIALISPLLAMIVWLGKHRKQFSSILPALPIGLMVYLSFNFGFLYVSVTYLTEFIMLLLMVRNFYRHPKQLGIVIALSLIVAIILREYAPFAF